MAPLQWLYNYVSRVQSVLQAGKSDNELLVYWPVYDVYSNPKGLEKMIKVHDIDEWLYPTSFYKKSKQLMAEGYSLDFVSDNMITSSKVKEGQIITAEGASAHKVLIIPQMQYMPVTTLQEVVNLAKEGAIIIMERLPLDVPGLHNLEKRREILKQLKESLNFTDNGDGIQQLNLGKGQILLAEDIRKALEFKGIRREELTDSGLKFIRRTLPDGKYYYLVNHSSQVVDTEIPINAEANSVVILDPQSGRVGLASSSHNPKSLKVRIQMHPGEALILRTVNEGTPNIEKWKYLQKGEQAIVLNGDWSLQFTHGGPDLPGAQKISELVSWPELPNPKAESFSGTGVYNTTFNLPSREAEEYILDLGNVRESARVWINEEEVGLLWSIPYRARVGEYLKDGENTIRIEVTNLMANRIRHMDKKGIEWRKYHEINFVNIDYKPFDASVWKPTPSGLLGPVLLMPYKISRQ